LNRGKCVGYFLGTRHVEFTALYLTPLKGLAMDIDVHAKVYGKVEVWRIDIHITS